jgi:hypothetical protein
MSHFHTMRFKDALFYVFLLGVLYGCKTQPKREQLIIDPYETAFWNRGLKYMVKHYRDLNNTVNFRLRNDTTFFDSLGNIIEEQMNFSNGFTKKNYNKERLVNRILQSSDVALNELIEYQFIGDSIKTSHFHFKHNDWDFSKEDVDSAYQYQTFITLNEGGKVQSVGNDGFITIYDYSNGRISSRRGYSGKDLFHEYTYEYVNGELKAIVMNEGNVVFLRYYFENGLPSYVTKQSKGENEYKSYSISYGMF